MRADYHLHTTHSMDGHMTLNQLCEAAIAAGLDEICLTEHIEPGHPDAGADIPPDTAVWLSDIAAARTAYPQLTIRAGIEIGDNPTCRPAIHAWLDALPLDFRLLSLHLVDNQDPYNPRTFEGKTQQAFYRRYVESKLESILAWPPEAFDSMAHLGYCAKFAPYPAEARHLRYHHAPDAFDALFRALAQGGKALEINTSGLNALGEPYPGRELLRRFAELGGEFVTIGSDAHTTERVGQGEAIVRELARDCGLRYGLTFNNRVAMPYTL
ncbi:MAG: histidinol-phosphatase HisJ family protein [Oscillospiraceae bacterium]|jgi:histidinol-phosphatase (PHP family)|nr:histidinol-phosphatase HisJ family protein [Oscillospiraceae bacterium]